MTQRLNKKGRFAKVSTHAGCNMRKLQGITFIERGNALIYCTQHWKGGYFVCR